MTSALLTTLTAVLYAAPPAAESDTAASFTEALLAGREDVRSAHVIAESIDHMSQHDGYSGMKRRFEIWFADDKWRMDVMKTTPEGKQVRTSRVLSDTDYITADWGERNSFLNQHVRDGETRHDASILDPRVIGRLLKPIGGLVFFDPSRPLAASAPETRGVTPVDGATTAVEYIWAGNHPSKTTVHRNESISGFKVRQITLDSQDGADSWRAELINELGEGSAFPRRTEFRRWKNGELETHNEITLLVADRVNEDIEDGVFSLEALQTGDVDDVWLKGGQVRAMRDGRIVTDEERFRHDVETKTSAIQGRPDGWSWLTYLNIAGAASLGLLAILYFRK